MNEEAQYKVRRLLYSASFFPNCFFPSFSKDLAHCFSECRAHVADVSGTGHTVAGQRASRKRAQHSCVSPVVSQSLRGRRGAGPNSAGASRRVARRMWRRVPRMHVVTGKKERKNSFLNNWFSKVWPMVRIGYAYLHSFLSATLTISFAVW